MPALAFVIPALNWIAPNSGESLAPTILDFTLMTPCPPWQLDSSYPCRNGGRVVKQLPHAYLTRAEPKTRADPTCAEPNLR